MKLGQLLSLLSYGELSNQILEPANRGTLTDMLTDQVLAYINTGLTDIYTRLPLLEKEVALEAQDEIHLYYLQKIYAVQDPTIMPVGMKYLQDTADDPFLEDVVRINAVYDELGSELPLNEPDVEGSLFTPKYDALQLPTPVTGAIYTVLFQAKHPEITGEDLDAEIMLPPYLEGALRAYIGAKIYDSMNGPEHAARALSLIAQYEAAMTQAQQLDLARTSQAFQNNKFDERGFI